MTSAAAIIDMWPSAEKYAADIGLKYPSYARVMKLRGRIPERYWDRTVAAAKDRGLTLSREAIEAAHASASAGAR